MEKLKIKAGKDSPEVVFDPNTNNFSVKGICHPENVTKFFAPVMVWLEDYLAEIKKTQIKNPIKIVFFFRYFNSATYKYLITLLHKINEYSTLGISVTVEWQFEHEDEEMKEAGVELFEFSGIKIPYVCVESKFSD